MLGEYSYGLQDVGPATLPEMWQKRGVNPVRSGYQNAK
jgi:hypothetical protein